jgi:hypothetical protein
VPAQRGNLGTGGGQYYLARAGICLRIGRGPGDARYNRAEARRVDTRRVAASHHATRRTSMATVAALAAASTWQTIERR